MVVLLYLIPGCAVVIAVFAAAAKSGLKLADPMFSRIASHTKLSLAQLAFVFVAGVVSCPFVILTLDYLPDFRTPGDGGVGMAQNGIARMGTVLLIPAIAFVLIGSALNYVSRRKS